MQSKFVGANPTVLGRLGRAMGAASPAAVAAPEFIVWEGLSNAVDSGSGTVTKNGGGAAWNGGGNGTKVLAAGSGGGYIEFKGSATNKHLMCGFALAPLNYGIGEPYEAVGTVLPYLEEGGSGVHLVVGEGSGYNEVYGATPGWTTSDIFRLTINDARTAAILSKNGTNLHTYNADFSADLYIVSLINQEGGAVVAATGLNLT